MTARLSTALGIRVLFTVIVIAVILVGQRAWAWHDTAGEERRADAAAAAASDHFVRIVSVSAEGSEEAFDELLESATAGMRDELRGQVEKLRASLDELQVEATGSVVSAGVTASADDRASVVVAATGLVRTKEATAPTERDYQATVEMRNVEGEWLVAGLELVP